MQAMEKDILANNVALNVKIVIANLHVTHVLEPTSLLVLNQLFQMLKSKKLFLTVSLAEDLLNAQKVILSSTTKLRPVNLVK